MKATISQFGSFTGHDVNEAKLIVVSCGTTLCDVEACGLVGGKPRYRINQMLGDKSLSLFTALANYFKRIHGDRVIIVEAFCSNSRMLQFMARHGTYRWSRSGGFQAQMEISRGRPVK